MEGSIVSGLIHYERDFLMFKKEMPKLRELNPNRFVAFRDGQVVSTGLSVNEITEDLNSKGIEPSGTVIEFVSEKEIKVIV